MSFVYPHFDFYYLTYNKSFIKPADSLVLFYHWYLVHNKFKCLVDNMSSSLLPEKWNTSKEYYNLFYIKREIQFRLEIYVINSMLHIQIRRLSDMMDTLQLINITDYVNEGVDYTNKNFEPAFKNLDQLYKRIEWAVYNINPPKPTKQVEKTFATIDLVPKPSITTAEIINLIKNDRKNIENLRRDSSSTTNSTASSSSNNLLTYQPSVAKQKKTSRKSSARRHVAKKSFDSESELPPPPIRIEPMIVNEIVDSRSDQIVYHNITDINEINISDNPTEINSITKIAKSTNALNRKDLFDYNPITNYFNYNNKTELIQSIDEKKINDDEFVKRSFAKYTLKSCCITLNDCFNTDILKNFKSSKSISLTETMKKDLNLIPANKIMKIKQEKQIPSKKQPRKARLTKTSLRSMFSLEKDLDSTSIAESDLESVTDSIVSNELIFKRGTKRKRNRIDSIDSIIETTFAVENNKRKSNEIDEKALNLSNSQNDTADVCNLKSKVSKARKIKDFFSPNEQKTLSEEKKVDNCINNATEAQTSSLEPLNVNTIDLVSDKNEKENVLECSESQPKRIRRSSKSNDENENQANEDLINNSAKVIESNVKCLTPLKQPLQNSIDNSSNTPNNITLLPPPPGTPKSGFVSAFLKTFNISLPDLNKTSDANKQVPTFSEPLKIPFSFNFNSFTAKKNDPIDATKSTPTKFSVNLDITASYDSDDCCIVDEIPSNKGNDLDPFGVIKVEQID